VKVRVAVLVLLTGILAAGSAQATGLRSGLYGDVTRGPISPVCVAEQPCDEPAAGAVLVFSREGREIVRAKAKVDGSYRVRIPAGVYVVRAGRRVEPAKVRVLRGRMLRVNFSIDTGIR
jgi:hypothetical protein